MLHLGSRCSLAFDFQQRKVASVSKRTLWVYIFVRSDLGYDNELGHHAPKSVRLLR